MKIAVNRRYSAIVGRRDALIGWSIIIPIFIYFAIVMLLPVIGVIALSFFKWDGFSSAPKWVAIKNFIDLMTSSSYLQAFKQTIIIGGIGMLGGILVGFLIALLLNTNIKGKGIFRVIWYIPVLTSYAIVSEMFLIFLDPVNGTFNNILVMFGKEPVIWQNSSFWMIFWITIFGIWKGAGGTAILFLAGFQGIDRNYYEAAMIDGANARQKIWYITIPLVQPMSMFVFITGVIGMFQIFDPIYLLTKGGPDGNTNVLVYQLYNDAFQKFDLGYAAAESVLILLLVGTATIISFIMSNKKDVT